MSAQSAYPDPVTRRGLRAGRPRHTGAAAGGLSPRDEIIDHAARLFVRRGYAATSTREIADAVGIRQASLYYHFAGKEAVLRELLKRTIRPTTTRIEQLETDAAEVGWDVALCLLLLIDVRTLAEARHNIGLLQHLPDVMSTSAFAEFASARADLSDAYERFAANAAPRGGSTSEDAWGSTPIGALLLQLAEVVIAMRQAGRPVDNSVIRSIAISGLRLCGDLDRTAADRALGLIDTYL